MKTNRLFNFTVKYLGVLKAIPLVPHLFDAWLKIWSVITFSPTLDHIDDIESEVLKWRGTSISLHKYGGTQFNYGSKELGHIHSNGLLDIRFSRSIKAQLIKESKITDHHVFKNSGWISFYITNVDDTDYAKKLLEMAYLNLQQ